MATKLAQDIEIQIHVSFLVLMVTNKLALTFERVSFHDVGLVKKRNVNVSAKYLQSPGLNSLKRKVKLVRRLTINNRYFKRNKLQKRDSVKQQPTIL